MLFVANSKLPEIAVIIAIYLISLQRILPNAQAIFSEISNYKYYRFSHQEVFETIRDTIEAGRPASAGTYGDKSRYEGMKLYANHNYAILGGGMDENTGEPYLILRNPWGQSEPDYNGAPDGKDDGIFRINMEDFTNYFMTYSVITESGRRGR